MCGGEDGTVCTIEIQGERIERVHKYECMVNDRSTEV